MGWSPAWLRHRVASKVLDEDLDGLGGHEGMTLALVSISVYSNHYV